MSVSVPYMSSPCLHFDWGLLTENFKGYLSSISKDHIEKPSVSRISPGWASAHKEHTSTQVAEAKGKLRGQLGLWFPILALHLELLGPLKK